MTKLILHATCLSCPQFEIVENGYNTTMYLYGIDPKATKIMDEFQSNSLVS